MSYCIMKLTIISRAMVRFTPSMPRFRRAVRLITGMESTSSSSVGIFRYVRVASASQL